VWHCDVSMFVSSSYNIPLTPYLLCVLRRYESTVHMVIQCSTKVCSFGKQVVEKIEVNAADLHMFIFVEYFWVIPTETYVHKNCIWSLEKNKLFEIKSCLLCRHIQTF